MTQFFIRNISVRSLLDNFFVSAVGTVLVTRAFLFLTGWPMIGGETLHIAHMLWGGLAMAASIILLLAFLGRRMQYVAAVIGGIGFGLFIDELGKFLTMDNNYFFQPTIMLIYLIFVGLYFLIRELDRSVHLSEEERVVNALDISKEMVMQQFDAAEKRQLMQLIRLPSAHEPLFEQLRTIVEQTTVVQQLWWRRGVRRFQDRYFAFVRSAWFTPFIILVSFVQGMLVLFSFHDFWAAESLALAEQLIVGLGVVSALVAGVYVIRALWHVRADRAEAYRKLYRANLISVLVTQPFVFYVAAFIPVIALAINLIGLFALPYLMQLEKRRA